MKGRLITDNVIVANEILHYMKNKRQKKYGVATIKIDIAKVYDKLEWDFLENMMMRLGFCSRWVTLIMSCVRNVKFIVLFENELLGPIIPQRGLRQGDPLSPYLFILCVEGLSELLQHREMSGRLHGCKVANGAPIITHLFFTDDSFLFCRDTVE